MSTDQLRLDAATISIAAVIGSLIGYVDTRPAWDDTGVTVGAIVLVAAALAAFRPNMRWLSGTAVGIPVLGMNLVLVGGWGAAMAPLAALLAAGMGGAVGASLRGPTARSRRS
ncbi:MAG TPA: hypothetical protein VFN22_10000 [Gemmatimonadales bacterium]|nr:hypothetical protein [Gemmatimonadales bacterium]